MSAPRILPALALLLTASNMARAEETALPIRYTLSEPGRVSLAVYDATGRMVRPMLYGQPHEPGQYTLYWDGLDRYGDPQPPGSYEWRLLRTPGFSREFLVNVGINTTWSPFDVWPGNHFGPNVLYVDDEGALYVGSVSSEGPPHVLKMSLDGKTKYWDTGTWGMGDGLAGLVRIGNVLYLQMGTTLDVRRSDNGGKFWGDSKLRRLAVDNVPLAELIHAGDSRDAKGLRRPYLAGGLDFLVVTYRDHNEVRFLWPVDDRFERERTVSVPQPGAVTVSPDGHVYVVSVDDVVEVDRETGAVTTILRGLPEPGKIAFDPVFRDLLVISARKCVRRYHIADGQLVAVYGRPEGRIYGLFDPLDFDGLLSIAADRRGGFVIAEEYPRRVAHFRGRERHELASQWFGGMQWGSTATIDPADPTIVYLPIDPRHLGRGKVDYETKSWTLTHLYEAVDHSSWNVGNDRHREILPIGGERNFWEVRRVSGETFLLNRGAGESEGSVTLLRVDENQNRMVPVAHLGGLHPTVDRRKLPEWWIAALKKKGIRHPRTFEGAGGYKHFAFSWSDRSQDGQVDLDEISLASVGVRMGGYSCYVTPKWDVLCPINDKSHAYVVIPNEGSERLPVWNWDHAVPAKDRLRPREFDIIRPLHTSIFRDREGATYLTLNNVLEQRDQEDVPPMSWPNNKNHSSRFVKWDADGSQIFSAGLHTSSKAGEPGVFADVRGILAEVRDCLVVMDACSPASVWTKDGLYAGAFTDDVGVSEKLDGWQGLAYKKRAHDDNQWGQIAETSQGAVVWGQLRDNSTPFYRVTGWDGWERRQGDLSVPDSPQHARRNGRGLTGEYFASADLTGEPLLRKVDPEIWFGTMRGDHRQVKALDYRINSRETRKLPREAPISVRWTGHLEPPVSEEFTFQVFTYGEPEKNAGARVRLWVAGELLIDAWDDVKLEHFNSGWLFTRAFSSPPIALKAGEPVPIKLEHASPGQPDEHVHLYWMSRSFDLRHVPRAFLYPQGSSPESVEKTARR
jgi:hypothetical protein